MQITDLLAQTGGLKNMAQELGVSEDQAANGAQALAPAVLGGFKKQAEGQPGGVEGLGGLLGELGGGGLLDDVLSRQPTDVSRGNNVLGKIFGSKDVSRSVAENAASRSGLDAALLKRMLPMVAMMVAGYMGKQRSGVGQNSQLGGGLGGMAGRMLSGASSQGGGGLDSLLNLAGDRNPLDDILNRSDRR
jgi:hypothetical protein